MSDDQIIEAMARAMEPVAWAALLDHEPTAMSIRHDTLVKATAALAAYRREAWRPISEAPKDGTRLLACGGGLDRVETCEYTERVGAWSCESCTLDDTDHEPEGYNRPTHFQPLPPPPEDAG